MFQISTFIFFFNYYYTPLFIQVKVSLRFKSHFQEGPGIMAAKVTKHTTHDNITTICTNMGTNSDNQLYDVRMKAVLVAV